MDIVLHEEHARLKEAQSAALERLSTLLCAYDDMILQQKPRLEAKYMEAFGALEQACYAAFVQSSELRRRIALTRAYLNRGAEPDAAEMDAQIAKEFREYEEKLRNMEKERARAAQILKGKRMSDEDAKRFKHLYRQIAKRVHSDLHPERTDEMKRLWNQVTAAYALGDLERLEILVAIVESKCAVKDAEAGEEQNPVTDSAIEAMRAQITKTEEQITKCVAALEGIEKEHPFKFVDLLKNPAAIDERKRELKNQIAQYQMGSEELEMQLAMLMRGRAEVVH
ncbi:hypothetical protein TAMA11512_16980 [Selenomonas sp. TAMA-11512]|uniref:hypothetical protein n=1 Tax=Selenomonas sp. TAMA-11512 TaxID=3095337 RepID=UPI003088D172|nr:hypothetical protein TAMA11512_16980 [Selenomonas sp. TAMA-11512]